MTSNAPTTTQVLLGLALAGLLSACGEPADSGDASSGEEQADESSDDGSADEGDDATEPEVTSTEIIPDLGLADFTADCDEAGGVVEEHSHCGGLNTCAGFSYDTASDELIHHTCAGLNTCAGFSCVTS